MLNLENVCAVLALIISLITIFQTQKGMCLSNKQYLFEKRLELFFMCQKIINFYEGNENFFASMSLDFENIKKAYFLIFETFSLGIESEFEKMQSTIKQISFLFNGNYVFYFQNFINSILFFFHKICLTYFFLEKIEKLNGISKKERLKLEQYFIKNTFMINFEQDIQELNYSFKYLQKKKVLKHFRRQTKLF